MGRKKHIAQRKNKQVTKEVPAKGDTDEVEHLGVVYYQTHTEGIQQPEEQAQDVAEEPKDDEHQQDEAQAQADDGATQAAHSEQENHDDGMGGLDGETQMEKEGEDEEPVVGEELDGEMEMCDQPATGDQPKRKKHRGPTKMKNIAKDPNFRERVEFTDMGNPVGVGSVKLSSYLGPLVREHVPVTVEDWRKLSEEVKIVLWKSVQARFELDEEYQKTAVLKQMGCLWRASKSRLVTQLRSKATTNQERMKLRPKNVTPTDWRKFVKQKTSSTFKVVSDSYKERRKKQIPHTCSRRGMVRLAEDMKRDSGETSQVTRLKVWVKSRTKKNGTPVNTIAAEKIKKAAEIIDNEHGPANSTDPSMDQLSQLLGPDNPGRLRAMGRNIGKTKLHCFEVKKHFMADMEEKQNRLQHKVKELEDELAKFKHCKEPEMGENPAAARAKSVNKRAHPKCVLVDWSGSDANVAEGRVLSTDPEDDINGIPLGPLAVKVFVDTALKSDAFLWRPAPEMHNVAQAVGEMIAWPASNCVVLDHGLLSDDIPLMSPTPNSVNKCKLLNWCGNDEVIAEGRWQCEEPKALVNGVPLGPNAVKVFVDVVREPDTFLWRPTAEMIYIRDSLKTFVAWPANKCVFQDDNSTFQGPPQQKQASAAKTSSARAASASPTQKSPTQKCPTEQTPTQKSPKKISPKPSPKKPQAAHSPLRRSQRLGPNETGRENQKCRLLSIAGKKQVVAEGRWASDNPDQKVHFVPLGPNAVRVWVDIVKVGGAAVWRPSSEIECMGDAIGSSIAWPKEKVILC